MGSMEQIRILIAMPCFNVESTVIEAIESIYNQTYNSFILICCDDKSTDGTLKVLENNRDRLGYFLITNDINIGTGETINKIIRKFVHDNQLLTWVSADNIMQPNFLQRHVDVLDAGHAISYSGWQAFGGNNINYFPNMKLDSLKEAYTLGPSFLFRKKLWDVAGPFNKLPGEDYYFAVQCIANNAKFGFINDYLVKYRHHDNSVSGRLRNGTLKDICTNEANKIANKLDIKNGTNTYEA